MCTTRIRVTSGVWIGEGNDSQQHKVKVIGMMSEMKDKVKE